MSHPPIPNGLVQRIVETPRLRTGVLERAADDPRTPDDRTVVLVHGNVSSALFWAQTMLALPEDLRVVAVDLRGFGSSEPKPIDATRGVRDFSDDLHAVLEELGIGETNLVGWSMGGGVVMQYALDHPVRTLTLQAPVSPYGFGGTRRDGSALHDDNPGCGGGGANPDFIQRLRDGDTSADEQTSPRTVFRTGYVAEGYESDLEDLWVASMLSTSTAAGNYPGDLSPSSHWPGFGAGTTGVLNTMAPKHFDVSGIVELERKPKILWIRGDRDAIVSDASFFDLNHLGALGVVPGWPGVEAAPAQPMVSQTRDVLEAYAAAGGEVAEVELSGVGHSPHLERPMEFVEALLERIGFSGIGRLGGADDTGSTPV